MSGAASSDPAAQPGRETPGATLGIAFGLLVLLGAVATLIARGMRAAPRDLAAWTAEVFPAGLPPEIAAANALSASELPGGDNVLAATPSPAAGAPERLFFVRYGSQAKVASLFEPAHQEEPGEGVEQGDELRRWEEKPDFAWHAEMERGDLDVGPWRVPFVRERAFQEGGAWSEAVRVNLSTRERPLILFALWPERAEADEDALRGLLAAVDLELAVPAGAGD
jgi:hypothetical protein